MTRRIFYVQVTHREIISCHDASTLTIRQSAVVRNELMDIKDTALDLISGCPNIKFSHVDSPLNPDTPLATFFQWVNPGQAATLRVTQALSIRAQASEVEEENTRNNPKPVSSLDPVLNEGTRGWAVSL